MGPDEKSDVLIELSSMTTLAPKRAFTDGSGAVSTA